MHIQVYVYMVCTYIDICKYCVCMYIYIYTLYIYTFIHMMLQQHISGIYIPEAKMFFKNLIRCLSMHNCGSR